MPKHEGDRMTTHRTQTIYADKLVSEDDDKYLWKVSGHLFDLLMTTWYGWGGAVAGQWEIWSIWLFIEEGIVKEYHQTADEDPANVVVHNYMKFTIRSRNNRMVYLRENEVYFISGLQFFQNYLPINYIQLILFYHALTAAGSF